MWNVLCGIARELRAAPRTRMILGIGLDDWGMAMVSAVLLSMPFFGYATWWTS